MSESPTETPTQRGSHALERLGLTQSEIDAYFTVVGKGVCLVSEIGRYAGVPEEAAADIVKKLLQVGLLKEIPGRTIRYQAIPPYSALLQQLEDFRDFITEMRQKVPQDLAEEFKQFEEGFERVSGLGDFKKFVLSVSEDIPQQMMDRFRTFADKFKSFQQLDEFQQFISNMRESAPAELSEKFASFEEQFSNLKEMDDFKNFVSGIREKAISELTSRFENIETGFTEFKQLDELKDKFAEIKDGIPDQLSGSFSRFQDEFKKVAGLEGFKDFVGSVKENLPKKIEYQFSEIENQFSQLKELQDFAAFVRDVTTSVPEEMVNKFQEFEARFRSVTGLEEFKDFLANLRQNVPQELAAQFTRFEQAIKGVKSALLTTSQDQFTNWMRIFGDIFQEFIEAFVSDVVTVQLEKLKEMFEREVLDAVMNILEKVGAKTETMSEEVLKSFAQIREWLVTEIITGLRVSLETVNEKVDGASRGVTEGFLELKRWITTEVTGDLERSLTEVDEGASRVAEEVMESVNKLQDWFDSTVISSLKTILGGLEGKLAKVVEDAQRELADVRGWFVKDAIAGIQDTLDATERNVEVVTAEVADSLSKLKEWFAGEAINQLGNALNEVQDRVSGASQEVIEGFAQMENWVGSEVVVTIKETLDNVTSKVNTAAEAIGEEVTKLRELFSERVVANTYNLLSKIEERLWDSEDTMRAFWDKALSEVKSRFQEVWFVEGADQMVGEIAQVVTRAKSKLFIVAPRLEDIDVVPLRLLSNRIYIRLEALIDPNSEAAMAILEEFIEKENVHFRNYTEERFWGVNKDSEEIILGLVSGEEVYGVGSIIDEHVKTFAEPMEHAWMEGRDVKSVGEAQALQGVKQAPRKVKKAAEAEVVETLLPARPAISIPKPTVSPSKVAAQAASTKASKGAKEPKVDKKLPKPTVSPSKVAAEQQKKGKEIKAAPKPAAAPKPVASPKKQVVAPVRKTVEAEQIPSAGAITAALQASKQASLGEIQAQVDDLKNTVLEVTKAQFAKQLDQLKDSLAMKLGFSRVVFDISKYSREFAGKVKEKFMPEEAEFMNQIMDDWMSRLSK
ncbi:MAG TPA: helix-turn-helix domain-containing protein [Candidatus Lokiarchaeia archaeon]|nr:helix-turn-helix domain-containing protein [Candidatus Lokiarchaeia archaeon]